MSDTAKQLFAGLSNVVFSAEMKRLTSHGAAELSSALFHGSAFVQYGADRYPANVAQDQQAGIMAEQGAEPAQTAEQPEVAQSRGMER